MRVLPLLRWLIRSITCLFTALLLVGLGVYLHYLFTGPPLGPWHRVRFQRNSRPAITRAAQ
jgi:hypothetical protein